jgi:hypothetical protein
LWLRRCYDHGDFARLSQKAPRYSKLEGAASEPA